MAKKRQRTLKDSLKAQPAPTVDIEAGREFARGAARGRKKKAKKEPQYREHERMLSVRLDAELLDALDAYAERRRSSRAHPYSKSGIIAEALLDYLEAQDRRLTALRDRVKVGR